MKTIIYAATALAVAAPAAPVFAMTTFPPSAAVEQPLETPLKTVSWRHYYRYHPHYGGYYGAHGGYRINRYGYGNYVGGPGGGFAGYPPGSAGARIYKQKEEWKCQNVPETC